MEERTNQRMLSLKMQIRFFKILEGGVGKVFYTSTLYVILFLAQFLWHRKITNIYLHQLVFDQLNSLAIFGLHHKKAR